MLRTKVDRVVSYLALGGFFVVIWSDIDGLGVTVAGICSVGEAVVGWNEASAVIVVNSCGEGAGDGGSDRTKSGAGGGGTNGKSAKAAGSVAGE